MSDRNPRTVEANSRTVARAVLVLAGLLSVAAADQVEAQPTTTAVGAEAAARPQVPAAEPNRARIAPTRSGDPVALFARLEAEDPRTRTGSRRLLAGANTFRLGGADDVFYDLVTLPDNHLVAAGQRRPTGLAQAGPEVGAEGTGRSEGAITLVLARIDLRAADRAVIEVSEAPRSIAGNRQIAPRLSRIGTASAEPSPSPTGLTLAWLEPTDARRSEVWAADLEGDDFGIPYRLAGNGPGGQIGLVGTTLDDGTQLFLWSRFDGEDSEIVWVQRDPREQPEWTAPQRLHTNNAVPDINPTVMAVGNTALAAWSSYDYSLNDGTYRVYLSRFDGTRSDGELWTAAQPISGAGGLYPRFEPGPELPTLSYRDAKNRQWTFRQFDRDSRPLTRTVLPQTGGKRPVLIGASDAGLTLVTDTAVGPSAAPATRGVVRSQSSSSTDSPPLTGQASSQGASRLVLRQLTWQQEIEP